MTENESFIYESIFNQVRMGFLSIQDIKEDIVEEIFDNGFVEEISEQWAFNFIDLECTKLKEESKNWKRPTDTDRLIEAFDELCDNNIIALHNAGFTTSDGEYEVVQVERSLGENQRTSDGYCFYHEKDLQSAISLNNPCLYIAYQKVDNTDGMVTLKVGKKVVKVLKEKGFEINWNEDVNKKILIPDFKWQLIYDASKRELQNYEQTIEKMLTKKQIPTNTKIKKGVRNKIKNLFK